MRRERACALPQAHQGGGHGADPEGEHPRQPCDRGREEERERQGRGERRTRSQAGRRTDGVHRHDGPGEERHVPDGLEAAEQGHRLLPQGGREGGHPRSAELQQGAERVEAGAAVQGTEPQR